MLDPENETAWDAYGYLSSAFVQERGAQGLVMDVLGLRFTRGQARGFLDRLIAIHEVIAQHGREQG